MNGTPPSSISAEQQAKIGIGITSAHVVYRECHHSRVIPGTGTAGGSAVYVVQRQYWKNGVSANARQAVAPGVMPAAWKCRCSPVANVPRSQLPSRYRFRYMSQGLPSSAAEGSSATCSQPAGMAAPGSKGTQRPTLVYAVVQNALHHRLQMNTR